MKLNKQSIITTTIVLLLIFLAILLRNIYKLVDLNTNALLISGGIRGLIYIGLFSVWGYFLNRRIMQTQVKHFFVLIASLMVFWIVVRTLKFEFFSYTFIGRDLWYLYYLPMLFIPLLSLFVALSLGKSQNYRLPKWTNILFCISLVLFILVITNDLHQMVFAFKQGLMHFDSGEYTHQFVYYIIMLWIVLCSTTTFVFIIKKCRVSYSKQFMFIPLVPLFLLVLYAYLYVTAHSFIKIIAGDMTVVICLLTALSFEACIKCGLIQTNSHYDDLFKCTSIDIKIFDDDYNNIISSSDKTTSSKEMLKQVLTEPVMLDEGYRLCGSSIKNGHVFWLEDVSKMNNILVELADNNEYLNSKKSILHKEVDTSKEEQHLIEQNRLYNRLMNDNKEEYSLFEELINQIEASDDPNTIKKLTAKLAVVCTYLKRRINLIFISEKNENINGFELKFALDEWLSNLRLCGVNCNLYFNLDGNLTFDDTISIYDTFQWLLNNTLDTLTNLLVTVDKKDDKPHLILNLSFGDDLFVINHNHIEILDKDGNEWVVSISVVGGENNE